MSAVNNPPSESGRNATADRIASVAWSLEGHAEALPGGERVASMAHRAADALTVTSDYVREHDLSAMVQDAKAVVKRHPLPIFLGVAALGFLLTRALSRK